MRLAITIIGLVGIVLAGCATVETGTTTTVSSADIPGSKYRNLAVFVENVDDAERLSMERMVVSAVRDGGAQAQSSLEAFGYHRDLDGNQMATIIRDQKFDAALYVTVTQKALLLEPAPDASAMPDGAGGWNVCKSSSSGSFTANFCFAMPAWFTVTSDGQLARLVVTYAAKAELQDVVSAKVVWTANTSASARGGPLNMRSLVNQASAQLVEKLRADHAI
jgi:hypothetical protein